MQPAPPKGVRGTLRIATIAVHHDGPLYADLSGLAVFDRVHVWIEQLNPNPRYRTTTARQTFQVTHIVLLLVQHRQGHRRLGLPVELTEHGPNALDGLSQSRGRDRRGAVEHGLEATEIKLIEARMIEQTHDHARDEQHAGDALSFDRFHYGNGIEAWLDQQSPALEQCGQQHGARGVAERAAGQHAKRAGPGPLSQHDLQGCQRGPVGGGERLGFAGGASGVPKAHHLRTGHLGSDQLGGWIPSGKRQQVHGVRVLAQCQERQAGRTPTELGSPPAEAQGIEDKEFCRGVECYVYMILEASLTVHRNRDRPQNLQGMGDMQDLRLVAEERGYATLTADTQTCQRLHKPAGRVPYVSYGEHGPIGKVQKGALRRLTKRVDQYFRYAQGSS